MVGVDQPMKALSMHLQKPDLGKNCLSSQSCHFVKHFCHFAIYFNQRTSDVGNGDHSVSLPIILIKMKVDQMLPSTYISSLLVSIL